MTEVKNEKMNRVTVHLDEKPIYDIVMTEDFSALPGEIEKLSISNRRLCIVTDSNVEKLYLNEVKELLAAVLQDGNFVRISGGEEHKNLDTVRDLYETLILNHFDRNDMLAHSAAELWAISADSRRRPICVALPSCRFRRRFFPRWTAALAARRALILTRTKIWLGAFHMPKLVFTNINTLQTLPDNQFSAGMGEVIKHGLIKDAAYYEWLLESGRYLGAKAGCTPQNSDLEQ